MVHQMIRITTMTVVTIMICSAFSLDSCMPWMFFHQKYSTIRTAKTAEKWSSEKTRGWWTYLADIFDEARQILPGRNGADGAGEHVVEQQRGHRKLGQRAAHGFLDYAVHAAAHEHAAGLDIESAHAVAEQHHRQNEPGGALADDLLGVTAGVISRRSKVGKDNGGRPPERDEGQHHRGGDEHLYRGTPDVWDG